MRTDARDICRVRTAYRKRDVGKTRNIYVPREDVYEKEPMQPLFLPLKTFNQHLPFPQQALNTRSGLLRHPDTEGQSPTQ